MRRDGDGREGWEVAASETGCEGPCLNSELASWDFEGNCVLVITHCTHTTTHTLSCVRRRSSMLQCWCHIQYMSHHRCGMEPRWLPWHLEHTHTHFICLSHKHTHTLRLPRCGAPAALHTLPTTQCSRRAYRIKLKLVTPP